MQLDITVPQLQYGGRGNYSKCSLIIGGYTKFSKRVGCPQGDNKLITDSNLNKG